MNLNRIIQSYTLLSCLLFCLCNYAQTEQYPIEQVKQKKIRTNYKINYIHVKMPEGEIPMGITGFHYDFALSSHFYGGVGMYAAIVGDQGGLFTLGAELGFQQRLFKNIYFDTDFHFGGGGGYRYLVKDGGYINSNSGFKIKAKQFEFGIQYSYFDFYKGSIKSNSVSAFVSIPATFRYSDYSYANNSCDVPKGNTSYPWKRKAIKNAFQLRFDHFFPIGDTKDQWHEPIENTLYTLGFEYDQYLNRKWFSYVHLDAMYKGLTSGFMDLFLGIGYEPIQTNYFKVFTKFGAGASGGRVEREGGLTIYPNIGIETKLFNEFSLTVHGGYMMAPYGNFEVYTLGYGLKYTGFKNGTSHPELENKQLNVHSKGSRFSLQNQTYFQAQSTQVPPVDLQLIALQFNYDLTKQFYITGQAAFAYDGKSGGYADGMVGLGWYSPKFLYNKIQGTAEFLAGAAGGAHIDTGAGLAIKPKLGLHYFLRDNFSFLLSGGKIIAPYGNLNSANINVGISFHFSSLNLTPKS